LKVSIITATLNSEKYIYDAINSVQSLRNQYCDVEHIIIDGGSTDSTLDILRHYDGLQIISEYDNGIYDAFNKGINLSTGEFILFLNSDDCLESAAITESIKYFELFPDLEMVTGSAGFIDSAGNQLPLLMTPQTNPHLKGLLFGVPCINARTIRRHVFDKYGLFNTSLDLCADRLWLIDAMRGSINNIISRSTFYRYRMHSSSRTISNANNAKFQIYRDHRKMNKILKSCISNYTPEANTIELWATSIKYAIIMEDRRILKKYLRKKRFLSYKNIVLIIRATVLWRFFRKRHSDAKILP